MKLFLVRHGETEENVAGVLMGHHHGVLTEKGKQQAKETAETLKNYKFNHIYSSDLNRCVDTAELIKEFHPDIPLTFTKELRERNLGELQGKPATSVDWGSLTDDEKPKGGESRNESKIRALTFIKQLYNQYPGDNLLLISHNGLIRQIISHFTSFQYKDIAKVGNAQVIEVEVGEGLKGKILNS